MDQLPVQENLPDPLVGFAGKRIATKEQWNAERRPELKALFQHYMYGYFPSPPKVTHTVELTDKEYFGGKATKKQITLRFGPKETPPIHLLLVIPNERTTPPPVFIGMNFCGNHQVLKDASIPLPGVWMPNHCAGCKENRATDEGRGAQEDVWAIEATVTRGYAVATFYCGDVDPDRPDFTDGVHPHFAKPGKTTPGRHDWGTIAAWAWGMHRAVDYLVTDADVDKSRIVAVGHSRLGKTALLAAAFDERIALCIPHQAGCGGTAPSRGKIGESVKRINDSFPHWFCDEFTAFNDQPARLPFDQHALIALCAPRPVLLTNAVEDTWANPAGQFEMLQAADPVYRLVGSAGLEAKKMPAAEELSDGKLGYYIRAGKHSMTRGDWQIFLKYADRHLRPSAR
ncbi:MAG: acetylxylan esterase [Pirellulales bacterium]